jgi:cytoskeleton protein RodZ
MTDDNDIVEDGTAEDEERGPVAGERLAEARRELQIPVIDIAKELHLDEFKVRALESNDFDVIGAPVFAKGHLRKYAQLVRVSEADVMADYYQLNRSVGTPPVVTTRPKPRRVISPGPWLAAIIVIAIVASAYWWFAVREASSGSPVTGTVTPLPERSGTAIDDGIADTDSDANAGDERPDEVELPADDPDVYIEDEPETEPQAAQPQTAVPASPDVLETRLSITYSGDCWTEITDASGGRLFFDLGKAGRTVNLSGIAPLNVLFGDAENVSIEVDGVPYTISAADRRGETARLTISGS